jgi:probable Rubsico expression protein CbbX
MPSSDPQPPSAGSGASPQPLAEIHEEMGGDHLTVDLRGAYEAAGVQAVLDQLDQDLVGLRPVKARIREIAALLVVNRARRVMGLESGPPSLHMSFTGRPGTGKTTVAERMSKILHGLGYVRKGHVVTATRDDLVGQYIGHTAPKTREMLKKAMGGVLFIDEAYYLYRPENERDYGAEAIEILLQVMENNRDDLVVIFAGYKERMDVFYQSNPGLSSRVANHIDFPDYSAPELLAIAKLILASENYRFSEEATEVFADYIVRRMQLPFFANARSIRNAIDRARMRQANRLFNGMESRLSKLDLMTIEAEDITASRVFQGVVEGLDRSEPLVNGDPCP